METEYPDILPDANDVFDKERNDAGIRAVCEAMDGLGLSLFERWHVCKCIEVAAFGMMSANLRELAEKLGG